jgi:hypothetical protein
VFCFFRKSPYPTVFLTSSGRPRRLEKNLYRTLFENIALGHGDSAKMKKSKKNRIAFSGSGSVQTSATPFKDFLVGRIPIRIRRVFVCISFRLTRRFSTGQFSIAFSTLKMTSDETLTHILYSCTRQVLSIFAIEISKRRISTFRRSFEFSTFGVDFRPQIDVGRRRRRKNISSTCNPPSNPANGIEIRRSVQKVRYRKIGAVLREYLRFSKN